MLYLKSYKGVKKSNSSLQKLERQRVDNKIFNKF